LRLDGAIEILHFPSSSLGRLPAPAKADKGLRADVLAKLNKLLHADEVGLKAHPMAWGRALACPRSQASLPLERSMVLRQSE